MKIVIVKEKLVSALSIVLKMISNQVTLPILSNVLLTTDKGRLKISATDLEVGIETWIGTQIVKEGSVTVPAKLFFEFLSAIDEEKITLEECNNKINITGSATQGEIRGLPANDFPLIPKIKKPILEISVDAWELKNALLDNLFSCATDETRPVLTGILLKITKSKYILAATDSYRLSESTIVHHKKNIKDTEVIIPKRTMTELVRIITDSCEKITISIGENQIAFELDDIYFISRLIEGSFPEYSQIIPKKFNTELVVDKNILTRQLRTASLFSRDAANNIKFNIAKNKQITISAYSQQLGKNQSTLMAESLKGKEIKFSVNAIYLLETLGAVGEDKIKIQIVDEQSPILIGSLANNNCIFVIMPLRQEG